ncbi:hypothetical protein [Clostridium sp. OS1-26]|uniref:hypothetical protein n=1 Tax=Clostridium sp. OS1-26 TaxID=3070681 RepID=UPI0027DEC4AB|nr:hypothetical protein [Clostridium sp. OS1-26]WML34329.1 hypothetical protein RCG18_24040 [Clostridium sp. OS1-26]
MIFDETQMSEAEVSLTLALYLIRNNLVTSDVLVAIDGAQIKTGSTVHFQIEEFLLANKCRIVANQIEWRGTYKIDNFDYNMIVHSNPGKGDVVAKLISGVDLRVESKKGPLSRSAGSKEYPLMREAIGQLMTIEEYSESDRLAVAIPYAPKFKELANRWKKAPLMRMLESFI